MSSPLHVPFFSRTEMTRRVVVSLAMSVLFLLLSLTAMMTTTTFPGVLAFGPPHMPLSSGHHSSYTYYHHYHHSSQGPSPPFRLFMVSQKEKRRLQDGAKRQEAYEELQVHQARAALVVQLQDLLGDSSSSSSSSSSSKHNTNNKKKKKNAATATRKLLKKARHDGLEDIGKEAQWLAMEIFYKTNRPSDIVQSLLVKNKKEEDPRRNQVALWAHAKMEDWPSAGTLADQLYNEETGEILVDIGSSEGAPSSAPFSKPREQHLLTHYAIQAFANSDQHTERAMKLLTKHVLEATPNNEDDAALATASVNALLRSHVRTGTFQEFKSLFQKILHQEQQTTNVILLDDESYRLSLDCAAQLGDIELMEQAVAKQSSSSKATRRRILETLAKASTSGTKLSSDLKTLAKETLQDLLLQSGKSNLDIDAENILSPILLAFDTDYSEIKAVVESYCRHANTHKTFSSWHSSLTVPAKVQVLPVLFDLEFKNYTKGGDAWKVLTSLVKPDKKTGAISAKSRTFLREQKSKTFHSAAWLLANEELQFELCQTIVQECWETIFFNDRPDRAGAMVTLLSVMRNFPSESVRIEIFSNILNHPQFHQKEDRDETLPSFANEKLTLIVQATVRWLRNSTNILASSSVFSDIDDNSQREHVHRILGIQMSITAMLLVSVMEEFSVDYYWDHGPSDNGAKEALQTIMKELLLSNLLADDDALLNSAIDYYFALARVSQSSTVIDYEDLFFAFSGKAILESYENPFQQFRNIVLEKKQKQEWAPTKMVLNLAASMLDETGDFGPLLRSIVCMASLSDKRTGGNTYGKLALAYKNYFFNWRSDLFFDRELLSSICDALDFQTLLPIRDEAMFLTTDFAGAMIKRLGEIQDARYWIGDKARKLDSEVIRMVSAKYLVNIYAQASVFDRIIDEDNSVSLGEAYIDACGKNSAFLMDTILSAEKLKAKAVGRRGRKDLEAGRWTLTIIDFFQKLSEAVVEMRNMEEERSFDLKCDILVDHLLNSLSYYMKDGVIWKTMVAAIVSTKSLDAEIEDAVENWLERNKGQEEKEGS